ncbi:MAG: hypothetical protein AAB389_03655 [Patescibacteria group bacterium]
MNLTTKKINQDGQSVIEIVVALGIFAVSLAASFQLFFGGQTLSEDSLNAELAINYTQEGIEATRTIRDRNWAELTSGDHGLIFNGYEWMFGSSSVSDSKDIFTRIVSIYSESENERIATTTVTWATDGRSQLVELVEKLTNWEYPLSSSCKTYPLSGNWSAPQTIGTGDLGAGNEGTDIVVQLPYVFMSGKASSSSKPDIFVFNVSTPTLPVLVASLDIGSGGINSLHVSGNYLYAASPNDSKELIIFNISSPVSISEVGYLDLSGSSDALSVVVFGNTAAVGRTDSASSEIAFINIANPASPSVMSQITTGGSVYDFAASSDRLFAVSKQSDDDIFVFDISETANPISIANYDIPGSTEDLSIYLHYKGGNRNLLVGNEENELVVLGATTTSAMYARDRIDVGGDVNDIVCAVGDLAFLATSYSTKEFIIVNIANPDNIVEYASLNYPQQGTGIDFAENMVFMSVRSNDALRIITSQ